MSTSTAHCLRQGKARFLPFAGITRSVATPQVQHFKYRPLQKYAYRPLVEALCGQQVARASGIFYAYLS